MSAFMGIALTAPTPSNAMNGLQLAAKAWKSGANVRPLKLTALGDRPLTG